MSAFLVSDEHLNAIVSAAQELNIKFASLGLTTFQQVKDELESENVQSFNYRYPRDHAKPFFGQYRFAYNPDVVQNLKLISCLDYQSCEHPEWKDSKAFKILAIITSHLVCKLAGYNDKKWAI